MSTAPLERTLDVIDSIVCELANDLPDFPRAVGFAVMQVPGQRDVGSKAGGGAGAAGDGDVGAGDKHAGTDDVAAIDGVAQGNIAKGAIGAHVAHGGETGFERDARVGHGLERDCAADSL